VISRLFVSILLLSVGGFAHAETRSGSKLVLNSLLTSESPNFVLMGAKSVERDAASDQFTLDVVAELLSERATAHVGSGLDIDTAAWLMKALGASKSSRYRPVIDKAISAYANKKVTTFGNLSLAELTKPADTTYLPGSISLVELRRELQADRAARVAGSTPFSALKTGDSVDSLIANFGYPNELIETVDSHGHGVVKIRVRSLQFLYVGRGLVDVDNHFNSGLGWTVSAVWPDLASDAPPYAGSLPNDAALVMTSEPMVLLKLSRKLVSRHVTEPELLDRVVERIKVSMNSKDGLETDALRFFCRLLGNSKDKKYIESLAWIAGRSMNPNVAYAAKVAGEQLAAP
jgi:hypothetical protein